MPALSNNASDEGGQKRMRKGTHSCAECRRRKKSCVVPADGEKCTDCAERGVECLRQESRPAKHPRVDSKQGLQDRVYQLESTVQALVDRLDGSTWSKEPLDVEHQVHYGASSSSPDSEKPPSEAEHFASAPVLSLFDNGILSRRGEYSGQTNKQNPKNAFRRNHRIEMIRHTLLSLFPPGPLEEQIMKSSSWWVPWQDMFPRILGVEARSTTFREFVLAAKASGNVQKIAKALLSLTLTLQEARGSDDLIGNYGSKSGAWSNVSSNSPFSGDVESCLKSTDELILSDDELVSTIDGIECLILQSKHDANDGRIRRSWIYHRRGLFLAQLIGLHRRTSIYPAAEAVRRESVWKALYEGDRFMSLLLGLPYGVAKIHTEMDTVVTQTGANYFVRLAEIAGDVIDRNLDTSSDHGFLQTVQIEGKLNDLAKWMPSSWWLPDFSSTEDVGVQMFHRLLPQFWHHQVRALLHLPFMLKANQDRQCEYNRIAALDSAREMIIRYQILRPMRGFQSLVCKIIDFQVFTAAMLLVLNLLGSKVSNTKHTEEEDDRDWDLLISTNDMLQRASQATDGVVASQAVRALSMFTKARNCKHQPEFEATCRVVIPYFGTVVFGPGKDFASGQAPPQTSNTPNIGLPTPAESHHGSIGDTVPDQDPFVSFDSCLAQLPLNMDFAGQPVAHPAAESQDYDFALTDVNLDLDQDWTWYPR